MCGSNRSWDILIDRLHFIWWCISTNEVRREAIQKVLVLVVDEYEIPTVWQLWFDGRSSMYLPRERLKFLNRSWSKWSSKSSSSTLSLLLWLSLLSTSTPDGPALSSDRSWKQVRFRKWWMPKGLPQCEHCKNARFWQFSPSRSYPHFELGGTSN